jgi:hypothetical protein
VYFYAWGPVVVKMLEVGHGVRRRGGSGSGSGGGGGGEEREGRTRRRKLETEVSDFWERNRPERERGYRIPEVNRRKGRPRMGTRVAGVGVSGQ